MVAGEEGCEMFRKPCSEYKRVEVVPQDVDYAIMSFGSLDA